MLCMPAHLAMNFMLVNSLINQIRGEAVRQAVWVCCSYATVKRTVYKLQPRWYERPLRCNPEWAGGKLEERPGYYSPRVLWVYTALQERAKQVTRLLSQLEMLAVCKAISSAAVRFHGAVRIWCHSMDIRGHNRAGLLVGCYAYWDHDYNCV